MTAYDSFGNVATGYNGTTATLSCTGLSIRSNPGSCPTGPISFSHGVSTTSLSVTSDAAGTATISATDTSATPNITTPTPASVTVNPAGAGYFVVTPSNGTATAGTPSGSR